MKIHDDNMKIHDDDIQIQDHNIIIQDDNIKSTQVMILAFHNTVLTSQY